MVSTLSSMRNTHLLTPLTSRPCQCRMIIIPVFRRPSKTPRLGVRRRETEVLAENRQALGFLTNFKPTHPYVRVDIPRTPVEFPRGCSSRTGRDRRRVRQMAIL